MLYGSGIDVLGRLNGMVRTTVLIEGEEQGVDSARTGHHEMTS